MHCCASDRLADLLSCRVLKRENQAATVGRRFIGRANSSAEHGDEVLRVELCGGELAGQVDCLLGEAQNRIAGEEIERSHRRCRARCW